MINIMVKSYYLLKNQIATEVMQVLVSRDQRLLSFQFLLIPVSFNSSIIKCALFYGCFNYIRPGSF